MPELPEVEHAVQALRRVVVGRRITRFALLHRSLRRRNRRASLKVVCGARVVALERRGKHQLFILDNHVVIHAHFRMTGEWAITKESDALPPFARAAIAFEGGPQIVLVDPRALGTLAVVRREKLSFADLGPEPFDPALTPETLRRVIAPRRGNIKVVLLDQRIIAGLGNIYAAESLWRAGVSPRATPRRLSLMRVGRLLAAIRAVLTDATGARYRADGGARFAVYDREGLACRRCGAIVRRIVQGGRSTYFCPRCQRR